MWFHLFSALYMVCTAEQTGSKSYTKEQTCTHNKGVIIRTRMPKKTITISTINRHILQKKKILQTETHRHTSNFQNSKSDKEHEQWMIILWNTFSENCDIHLDFYAFFTWFTFLLGFVMYIVFHMQYFCLFQSYRDCL